MHCPSKRSPRRLTLAAACLMLLSVPLAAQIFSDESARLQPMTNGFEWGTTAADFNSDGWVDIFERGKLYINREGTAFVDVHAESNIQEGSGIFGAVFGDYNNDGYLDLFTENFGSLNRLNRNLGFGRFDEVSAQVGLSMSILIQTAGWADFDGNGTLDIFVNDDRGNNRMYLNIDHERFQNISGTSGSATQGNSYGMAWGDYNNDGLPDVFIATCPGGFENHLLRNNGDATFTEVSAAAGVNDVASSWGNIWLDYDNDGWMDIYIANTNNDPNVLYRNNGDGTFTDVSATAGVTTSGGFGAGAADFDNDGWIDLYAATSGVRHALYRNRGDGTFQNISLSAGISEDSHDAVALADYNNDGWMDIFTAGSPRNRLMINQGGSNHWITVETRGVQSTYFGISARVELYTDSLRQIREIGAGDSFCSQNDLMRAHFGIGARTAIDSLVVRWPTGTVDVVVNPPVDTRVTVVEGVGINQVPVAARPIEPADSAVVSGARYRFRWSSGIDPEGAPLTYRLFLWGDDLDTALTVVNDTIAFVDTSLFDSRRTYRWSVETRDAHSLITTRTVHTFSPDSSFQVFSALVGSPVGDDQSHSEGALWGDIDGDGWQDLFVTNISNQPNLLFRNDGQGDFLGADGGDLTAGPGDSYGAVLADLDDDGDLDAFVGNGTFASPRNNGLYWNNGDGTFTAESAGEVVSDGGRTWSVSAVDYDGDGFLDLFAANYDQSNFLYRNNGDGTFTRITDGPVVTQRAFSLGHVWGDYDSDGHPDLFVAHGDLSGRSEPANGLYRNNGDGTFTAVTDAPIVTDGGNSTGGSFADYDGDGDLDLLVTNYFGEDNALYRNDGGTWTRDIFNPVNNDGGASVGSAWGDYDNDGDLDLYISNDLDENNFFYINRGTGVFERVLSGGPVSDGGRSNGTAWADYDRDGDLDLFVTNGNLTSQSNILYRNNNPAPQNGWIQIDLEGRRSNRSAIGARVAALATIRGQSRWQHGEVSGQTGYNAQNSLTVEFGLGDATQVDSLVIRWPSGIVQSTGALAVNQFLSIVEDTTLVGIAGGGTAPETYWLAQNYPNPFNPSTRVDFGVGRAGWVTLTVYDLLGRTVRTLVDEPLAAGRHTVTWNGRDDRGRAVSSGVYLYRLEAGAIQHLRKMLLVK